MTPFDDQEITGGSVSQDASGETTLTFTRPLSPTGDKQTVSATPGDETILIYGYGMSNFLGYHGAGKGAVVLDLFCGDDSAATVAVTPSPIGAVVETFTPTSSPTPAPAGAGDGDRGVEDSEDATPSPTGAVDPLSPTSAPSSAPSTAEDGSGQGDADSAFRLGGGGWVAMAATGIVMVVGILAL